MGLRVEAVKSVQNCRNGVLGGDTKPLGEAPERVVARLVRPLETPQRPFLRISFILRVFAVAASGNRHNGLSFGRNRVHGGCWDSRREGRKLVVLRDRRRDTD